MLHASDRCLPAGPISHARRTGTISGYMARRDRSVSDPIRSASEDELSRPSSTRSTGKRRECSSDRMNGDPTVGRHIPGLSAGVVSEGCLRARDLRGPTSCADRSLPASVHARPSARPQRVLVCPSRCHALVPGRHLYSILEMRSNGPAFRGGSPDRSRGATGWIGSRTGASSRTASVSVIMMPSLETGGGRRPLRRLSR